MRVVISKEQAAYERGYTAYLSGVSFDDNPYTPGSRESQSWYVGWEQARDEAENG